MKKNPFSLMKNRGCLLPYLALFLLHTTTLTLSLTHAFEPWSSLANGVVTSFHIQQKGCLDKILLYDKKEHC